MCIRNRITRLLVFNSKLTKYQLIKNLLIKIKKQNINNIKTNTNLATYIGKIRVIFIAACYGQFYFLK